MNEEASLDELRRELWSLQAEEAKLSAERRLIHDRIDFGFATESTRGREREISAERRRVQALIDSLQERLRALQLD